MSDVKRGAPTEPGRYIVLRKKPDGSTDEQIADYDGKVVCWDRTGTPMSCTILAHRPHVPLEVPALKKFERPLLTPTVGSHFNDSRPYFGYRLHNNSFLYWPNLNCSPRELPVWTAWTKEQCEAAGYEWPAECGECK